MGLIKTLRSFHRRTVRVSQCKRRRKSFRRTLRVESLEDRALLTAVPMLTLELQSDTGEPDDNVTTEAVIEGTVTSGDGSSGIDVEIDVDGDGAADGCVPVDEEGGFSVDLGTSLPYGERTVQARARQWSAAVGDHVFGSWESATFTYVDEDVVLAGNWDADGLDAGLMDELTDPVENAEGESLAAEPDLDPISEEPDPDLDPISEEPDLNIPYIVNFDAGSEIPNIWFFEGAVDYDRPTKLTIEFGGLLAGYSTEVESDGSFRFWLELKVNDREVVSAQAIGSSADIPDSDLVFERIG